MTQKKAPPIVKVKCPDCEALYDSAKGLSSHRRAIHGYKSEREEARRQAAKREQQRAIARGEITPPPAHKCQQCDYQAKSASALQWHVTRNHENVQLQCEHCDFVAKWKGGLTHHQKKAHPAEWTAKRHHINPTSKTQRSEFEQTDKNAAAIVTATSNGHHHQAQADDRDHRLEALATLTCGRIQQIIEGVAYSHDLPPRSLAALVIRTLGQTAKVW